MVQCSSRNHGLLFLVFLACVSFHARGVISDSLPEKWFALYEVENCSATITGNSHGPWGSTDFIPTTTIPLSPGGGWNPTAISGGPWTGYSITPAIVRSTWETTFPVGALPNEPFSITVSRGLTADKPYTYKFRTRVGSGVGQKIEFLDGPQRPAYPGLRENSYVQVTDNNNCHFAIKLNPNISLPDEVTVKNITEINMDAINGSLNRHTYTTLFKLKRAQGSLSAQFEPSEVECRAEPNGSSVCEPSTMSFRGSDFNLGWGVLARMTAEISEPQAGSKTSIQLVASDNPSETIIMTDGSSAIVTAGTTDTYTMKVTPVIQHLRPGGGTGYVRLTFSVI